MKPSRADNLLSWISPLRPHSAQQPILVYWPFATDGIWCLYRFDREPRHSGQTDRVGEKTLKQQLRISHRGTQVFTCRYNIHGNRLHGDRRLRNPTEKPRRRRRYKIITNINIYIGQPAHSRRQVDIHGHHDRAERDSRPKPERSHHREKPDNRHTQSHKQSQLFKLFVHPSQPASLTGEQPTLSITGDIVSLEFGLGLEFEATSTHAIRCGCGCGPCRAAPRTQQFAQRSYIIISLSLAAHVVLFARRPLFAQSRNSV